MSCDLAFAKATTEPEGEMAARAKKRKKELAKKMKAEGADPFGHRGVGAIWGESAGRRRSRVGAQCQHP